MRSKWSREQLEAAMRKAISEGLVTRRGWNVYFEGHVFVGTAGWPHVCSRRARQADRAANAVERGERVERLSLGGDRAAST
jgi:hypothetical protein